MSISSITISIFGVLLLCFSCKSEIDPIKLTGDIKISEIETQSNYTAPLILEDDVDKEISINGVVTEFVQGIYELEDAGYYELEIKSKAKTIQFVLLDSERGNPEWGLKKWVPKAPVYSNNGNADLEILKPKNYVNSISIPVIVRHKNWTASNNDYMVCELEHSQPFNLKKGVGSGHTIIDSSNPLSLKTGTSTREISFAQELKEPILLDKTIDAPLVISTNSLVVIDNDLTILDNGSLTIESGCILLINEGINIYNQGPINFNGTKENPILVTSKQSGKYFGGFISEGEKSTINGLHTFFSFFSKNNSTDFRYGHANHQALFKAQNTKLQFNSCYFLDSPGQIFYPEHCDVQLNNIIVQRVKTSGQINFSQLTIENSYFSDFPDDSFEYRDQDNDAIYIKATDAEILNSVFMNAKDDGIDTGSGEGGEINILACYIESCFHEGIAMSSSSPAVKHHQIKDCIISNCQQGAELGFSSEDHTVTIDNTTFYNNYIGARFGDNYEWEIKGSMEVKNCTFENNEKDIWNMVHKYWAPSSKNLTIATSNKFN